MTIFRFNWQSYNFDKYGLPQETTPPGQLLLYPIQVIQIRCISILKENPILPSLGSGPSQVIV